ncbi:PREDICTED: jmjC domain-containing protein 8 isoform X2 [Chinchilla lanigera]|uniref:jmjC domain-containing protein 8 isoform X2 n=1 Tax=Chinchilla lanigera TaxID=34839 RepID=UPI00038EE0F2|nr:PREDICTED: jmjC domain-containing protein 8 isoform X2 [Chinchilla lanigera]
MALAVLPPVLLSLWILVLARSSLEAADGGGWRQTGPGADVVLADERCTVERRSDLNYTEFVQRYAFLRPVILQGLTENSKFRALCSRESLLTTFGDHVVRLSTANTYSYQKVDLPFHQYVEQLLHPQDPASLGNGAGSGVPFHWHGPGFSEVIYGRKHWFLYPPEKTPEFHPNKTTLTWLRDIYPSLAPSEKPLECTIQAGEVLYFPDRWWHATLNLDTTVFISTFLG